jgi:hypothetical protein
MASDPPRSDDSRSAFYQHRRQNSLHLFSKHPSHKACSHSALIAP